MQVFVYNVAHGLDALFTYTQYLLRLRGISNATFNDSVIAFHFSISRRRQVKGFTTALKSSAVVFQRSNSWSRVGTKTHRSSILTLASIDVIYVQVAILADDLHAPKISFTT